MLTHHQLYNNYILFKPNITKFNLGCKLIQVLIMPPRTVSSECQDLSIQYATIVYIVYTVAWAYEYKPQRVSRLQPPSPDKQGGW